MSTCNSSWWKDKAENGVHSGDSKNFDGVCSKKDLGDVLWDDEKHDHMATDTGNIQTSTQTWVQVFTETNFLGRTATIGPNSDINMEDLYDDDGTGNMDDAIMSFKQFDQKPDFSSHGVVQYFRQQFPIDDSDSDMISYFSQDSEYEIYDPVLTNEGSQYKIEINAKHHQMETDDRAYICLYMDNMGSFTNSITVTYTMGDATEIPDWLINLVDKTIDVASKAAIALLDGAEEVASEGLATPFLIEEDEMIEDIANALTFVVDHMNQILAAVFRLQDDGGTTYFPAVVSHCIARVINAYYQELCGADPGAPMSFSDQAFFDSLSLDNKWDTDILKNNPFRDVTLESYPYRIYQPENSFFYSHGGAISSLKLDSVNDGHPDDHMILQMSIDPQGRLFSVIGTYDVYSDYYPDNYTPPSSNVLTYNSARQMIRIHPDGTVENLDYDNLAHAYRGVMQDVIAWYEEPANGGMIFSDQLTTMLDLGVDVIEAVEAAIN